VQATVGRKMESEDEDFEVNKDLSTQQGCAKAFVKLGLSFNMPSTFSMDKDALASCEVTPLAPRTSGNKGGLTSSGKDVKECIER